jgi:hypothetical protein
MAAIVLPVAAATLFTAAFVYVISRLDKAEKNGGRASRAIVIAAGVLITLGLVFTHGIDSESVGYPHWDILIHALGMYTLVGAAFAVITKRPIARHRSHPVSH